MTPNGHEESRMDRFERGLEHLLQSVARHDVQIAALADRQNAIDSSVEKVLDAQRQLLTAQVVFVDETRKAFSLVADAQQKSADAQRRTDEKIQELSGKVDTLIDVVDNVIRRENPQRPPQ